MSNDLLHLTSMPGCLNLAAVQVTAIGTSPDKAEHTSPMQVHPHKPGVHCPVAINRICLRFLTYVQVTAIGTSPDKAEEAAALGASLYVTWEEAVRAAKAAAEHPELDAPPGIYVAAAGSCTIKQLRSFQKPVWSDVTGRCRVQGRKAPIACVGCRGKWCSL